MVAAIGDARQGGARLTPGCRPAARRNGAPVTGRFRPRAQNSASRADSRVRAPPAPSATSTANQADMPVGGQGETVRDGLLNAPRWRRTGCRHPPFGLGENLTQIFKQGAFRRCLARLENIGAVADQGQYTGRAQGTQAVVIGRTPITVVGIELPIAGVINDARQLGAAPEPLGSGMEWVKRTKSMSKGPMVRPPDSGTSIRSTASSRPASASLRRTSEAVKGVA